MLTTERLTRPIALAVLVSTALLCGCSQNYSDKPSQEALAAKGLRAVTAQPTLSDPASASASAIGERRRFGSLSAVPPTGWQELPPSSSMRLAEFKLPGQPVESEDATLALFYFGMGQGGSVAQNIDRWYGQFTQPDGSATKGRSRQWQDTVGGMQVTMVDIAGTYSAGMGSGGGADDPATGYRMLGAIVASKDGPYFFKLVGPDATVSHWRQSFSTFIAGLR